VVLQTATLLLLPLPRNYGNIDDVLLLMFCWDMYIDISNGIGVCLEMLQLMLGYVY